MILKQRRGRKLLTYFHGMTDVDRKILEEKVDKQFEQSKKNQEDLHQYKIALGVYLDRYRKYIGIPSEDIALKIGVTIAQLRKYETGDTSISAAKFFLASCFLSHADRSKDKSLFFNSLLDQLQKIFYQTKVVPDKESKSLKTTTIQKVRKKVEEEIVKLDLSELRKVNQILNLINKNKQNVKNEDNTKNKN
jgi:transcriptional regulator with XRE-family HTH domain